MVCDQKVSNRDGAGFQSEDAKWLGHTVRALFAQLLAASSAASLLRPRPRSGSSPFGDGAGFRARGPGGRAPAGRAAGGLGNHRRAGTGARLQRPKKSIL